MTKELRTCSLGVPAERWVGLDTREREQVDIAEVELTPGRWPRNAKPLRYIALRFTPLQAELALGKGRNAMAIWQDLVDDHAFDARYASVRRYVKQLRGAVTAVEAHPFIVTAPGLRRDHDVCAHGRDGYRARQPVRDVWHEGRALFAALRQYQEQVFELMIADLDAAKGPLGAVRSILTTFIVRSRRDDGYGCMMVNTTIERGLDEPATAASLRRYWARLEEPFAHALSRAHAAGQLTPTKNAKIGARFLITVMQGLGVATKLKPRRALLADVVETSIAALS